MRTAELTRELKCYSLCILPASSLNSGSFTSVTLHLKSSCVLNYLLSRSWPYKPSENDVKVLKECEVEYFVDNYNHLLLSK